MKLLLHHPFRECEDVATVTDESGAPSYILTYNECRWLHTHPDDHMAIPELDDDENVDADDDEFENQEPADIELYQSFEALAGRTRNEHAVEFEDPDDLGDRDIDRDYDWSSHCGLYPDLDERVFWSLAREAPQEHEVMQAGSPDSLEAKQRLVFDAFIQHYQQIVSGNCSALLPFKS